jgi:hypothetical protein
VKIAFLNFFEKFLSKKIHIENFRNLHMLYYLAFDFWLFLAYPKYLLGVPKWAKT